MAWDLILLVFVVIVCVGMLSYLIDHGGTRY